MLAIRASSCTTVRLISTLPGFSGPINERAGRPAYEISIHQLEFLRNRMRFNWSQISRMLLVSRTTLWRRIRNLESFSSRHYYTAVTDSDLGELIRGLRCIMYNGCIMMYWSIEVASTVIQALVFWHHFLDRLGPTTLPNDELNGQLPEGGLPRFQPCFDRRVDKTWSNPLIDEKPSPEDPLWENCKN